MNKPDSMAKNMPKIAEVKLPSCGFKVADFKKKLQLRTCGVAVAEQHFLKSCGIAIAEVLPSSCGIAVADSKKSCACPPLLICLLFLHTCNPLCNFGSRRNIDVPLIVLQQLSGNCFKKLLHIP
jgi:hypothetical protein